MQAERTRPAQDEKLELQCAAKYSPCKTSYAALWRQCRKGVLARNGQRIFLEHWRYGRRLYTTLAAIDAFAKAVAKADQGGLATPSTTKPISEQSRCDDHRAADIAAARERLKEGGLLDS